MYLSEWGVQCQGNDHRFTGTFLPQLQIPSFSKSFDSKKISNWSARLSEVHAHCWDVWHAQLSSERRFKLDQSKVLKGGTIPPEIVEGLTVRISGLPPPKKYHKTK